MEENDLLQIELEMVSDTDATEGEVDTWTRNLLNELNQTDATSVELTKNPAPGGTKAGEAVTIGSLAITVLPALLPKIVETIQGWVMRGSNRTAKFKGKVNGQAVDFEGSGEDLQKILDSLSKAKPAKKKK